MRKVNKRDEIPTQFLEPKQAQRRIENFNKRTIKRNVQKDMKKLNDWVHSLNGKNVDTEKFLSRIYAVADLYMQEEVYPRSVCAKGCAHCCTGILVEATAIEISYIEAKADIDLDINWSAKSSVGSNRPTETEHCSLLDARTATCKAYKPRPLQCRLFSSFDHYELCEDPLGEHYTHRASSSPFWNLMLGNVALASHQAAAERDITAVADMRDWIAQK